jgi:hypothetical protein
VEVRAHRSAESAALAAVLAVVPKACEHASEWLGPLVEEGPPSVVLETRESAPLSGIQLALEENVADHAPFTGDGVVREEADSGELCARTVAVEAPEQLIAATYGQERRVLGNGLAEWRAFRLQVPRHESLFAILAAAHVIEVVFAGPDSLAEADRPIVEIDPSPAGAPLEHGDVSTIRVDVEVVGIEMADDDFHAAASQ